MSEAASRDAGEWEDEHIDTSYEPFSREPEYIEANRAFIRDLALESGMQILDLACGTATMTDLMLESIFAPDGWGSTPPPLASATGCRVVGLDLSRESLLLGVEHLAALGLHRRGDGAARNLVVLTEGTADCLPIGDGSVDLVIMGNAIQLVDDRAAMFGEIARVLRPGGRFAFNTSFYAGTYCAGTEHVYIRWVQEAVGYLARLSAERRAAGKAPIPRQRGKAGRAAFSRPWLSVEEYAGEMAAAGLDLASSNERTVMLDKRCFETIGAYAGLAKVLLSGYPVSLASRALVEAAGPTLAAVGMEAVPRYWVEVVARRRT